MSRRPNVLAIPVGVPVLQTFAAAFLSGAIFGREPLKPIDIADATIFVPTRRAGAALAAEIARATGDTPTLLPTILPLGDPDALDEGLAARMGEAATGALPVLGTLDRRLSLFGLIDAWRLAIGEARNERGEREPFHVGRSRADAFALAGDLAGLIEEAIIEGLPLDRLAAGMGADYRPERHSEYWTLTETFLKIAAAWYPAELAALGRRDPAAALIERLAAFASRIEAGGSSRPTVVLGSTGSVAATAGLMAAVARLEQGAVILPGLDLTEGADDYWAMVGAEDADLPTRYAHPQAMLKRTLQRIGVDRRDVRRLAPDQAPGPRERLLSELFRPAAATANWHRSPVAGAVLEQATDGISLVEAADEREEALCIALMFRQVLETPGKTAALVTPSRSLARAVQSELARWEVAVADSAGEALDTTMTASLARLALAAARPDAGAIDIMALLRHPLAALGLPPEERERVVDAIEIGALRGKRLIGGVAGLVKAVQIAGSERLDHAPGARRRLTPEALAEGLDHAERLRLAMERFAAALNAAPALRDTAAAHRTLVEILLAPALDTPGELTGEDGIALARLFDEIALAANAGPAVSLGDYAAMFEEMLGGRVVRPRQPGHPRLKIWGLLEARLLEADRLILGGLDEGVWPPDMRGDPFLNRPMRIAVGLQPPERRIGQTAHDFMMLLGAPDVVLTRAAKRAGAPAIASRFIRRLTAFAGADATGRMTASAAQLLGWARAIDAPGHAPRPVGQPAPRPRAGLTPERLSVTEIETLYRDPYAVFARRILKLDALPEADPPLDARDRGTLVHEALSRFTRLHARDLPADVEQELLAFGRAAFAEVRLYDPEAVEFWQRRFEAFVPWFVAWDRERRRRPGILHSEIAGRHDVALPDGQTITLSARADRIEVAADGRIAVIDYKTGQPPGVREVLRGLAPQLPLTAAMVARGAFRDLGAKALGEDVELAYLHVAKADGMGSERVIRPEKAKEGPALTMIGIIERQFAELESYLARLSSGTLGYTAHRIPKKMSYRGDYDHLARVAEWSLGGGENEESPS